MALLVNLQGEIIILNNIEAKPICYRFWLMDLALMLVLCSSTPFREINNFGVEFYAASPEINKTYSFLQHNCYHFHKPRKF